MRPARAGDDPLTPPADALPAVAERLSKTRRKQASHDLQALGEALLDFSDARLAALGLDESLAEAVAFGKRLKGHEARRRHLQLIGKLMRRVDAEPIRSAVAAAELGRTHDALALHRAERWRAELLADDAAITRFSASHPGADLQQLRALVRNARKDAALRPEERSGKAYRELYRFVREQAIDG